MTWLDRVIHRRQLQRDADEEIRQHLEEREDELVANGLSREEARFEARRAFGNVLHALPKTAAPCGGGTASKTCSRTCATQHAICATPSFAAAAILTLALGIGANAAVFEVVYALVLQPLPLPQRRSPRCRRIGRLARRQSPGAALVFHIFRVPALESARRDCEGFQRFQRLPGRLR